MTDVDQLRAETAAFAMAVLGALTPGQVDAIREALAEGDALSGRQSRLVSLLQQADAATDDDLMEAIHGT